MTCEPHNRERATPHRPITTAATLFPLRPIGGNPRGAASRCTNVTSAGANPMTRFSAARRLLLLSSMSLALVAASGCKPKAGADGEGSGAQSGELVIGAFLSLTGSKADFGIKTQQGALLAIDEANAAGGVGGRPVKLVILDDQGTADEAGNAVSRLIDIEKASAIMGEVSSSLSLVGGRIAQRRGIPMVSPSSTNSQVTEIGNFVFRTCFIDPFQGEVMATFAKEKQGFTRIAVIKDVRNDYSIGLAKSFIETFTKNGGTIVAEESYNEGDTDFSAQLTKIKALDAQALFVPGYYTEVGASASTSRSSAAMAGRAPSSAKSAATTSSEASTPTTSRPITPTRSPAPSSPPTPSAGTSRPPRSPPSATTQPPSSSTPCAAPRVSPHPPPSAMHSRPPRPSPPSPAPSPSTQTATR